MGRRIAESVLVALRRKHLFWDVTAIGTFAVIAVCIYYARGGFTSRIVDLTSDAANIATMAASRDYPERFQKDSTFSNAHASDFYVAFHVPVTRALYRFTGDYGLAFTVLLLPTLFLYLAGFYYLGKALVGNRALATAFAFANMILVKGPRDTAWGPFKDALPRFDHAILFALLVMLMWRFRDRRRYWWALFLGAGLGVYIHPVSTPALGAMLFGAAIAVTVFEGRLRARLIPLLTGAVVFAAAVTPFGLPFSAASFRTPEPGQLSAADAAEVSQIIEQRFSGHYLSPAATVAEYLARPQMLWGVLPTLVVASAVVWAIGVSEARRIAAFTWGGLAGLAVAAVLLPIGFELLTPPWKGGVFRGELPRALRYIVPLTYVLALTAVHEVWWRVPVPRRRLFVMAVVSCMGLTAFAVLPRGVRVVRAAVTKRERNTDTLALVDMLRTLCSVEHTILPVMGDPLVIRYAALRPLAFAPKDVPSRNSLVDARRWQENMMTLRQIEKMSRVDEKLLATVTWARRLAARFVVVELDQAGDAKHIKPPESTRVLFYNSSFIVLEIEKRDVFEDSQAMDAI